MNIKDIFEEQPAQITAEVKSYLDQHSPVVVLGAGNLGKKIASFLEAKELNFFSFADNNPKRWGEEINDKTVLSPKEVSPYLKENALWIVGIWSPGHSYKVTKEQLRSLGVTNIFPAAALMQLFPDDLLPHYHFQTPEYFLRHSNEIKQVYENLADNESKRQYLAHVDCRINLNFKGLPEADVANQYFPSDIVSLTDSEVFLDAGAYDGDTLRDFAKRTNNKFTKYLALEPDPVNYKKLLEVASTFEDGKVEVFPYAVGAEDTMLKFDATGGAGAGFNENGSIEVECKRVDDFFYDFKPTYLKFDIEGAELDALKGSEKTIETHRPKLAVCIYHLPDDLWTIFLYLYNKYPFYNFYARTHQYDGLDFVLYAIPK